MESSGGGAREHGSVPPTTLPQHNLTRYLRARLEVTGGELRWEVPRTLLGIVRVGTHRIRVPIGRVLSLRIRRILYPLRLVIGGAAMVAPFFFLPWWLALPIAILGAWVVMVSLGPHLEVEAAAREMHRAPVCFRHKFDAELYVEAVTDLAEEARRAA